MSALIELYKRANQVVPTTLNTWENQINDWCLEYELLTQDACYSSININIGCFLFDHSAERVVLAYAISVEQLEKRDANRMKGFPDPNVSVQKLENGNIFFADKGHFLGHSTGGILDINLFPHRRELNRGWSEEGKLFRKMERYVLKNKGTFFYHRPIYDDNSWIPKNLEYGVLQDDKEWWIEIFKNK